MRKATISFCLFLGRKVVSVGFFQRSKISRRSDGRLNGNVATTPKRVSSRRKAPGRTAPRHEGGIPATTNVRKLFDAAASLYSIADREVIVRLRLVVIAAAFILLPVLSNSSFAQNGGRGNGGRGNAPAAPAKPTPRWPDGTVNWGAPVGEKGGLWNVAGGTFAIADPAPGAPPVREQDQFPGKPTLSQVPFQPWARAIYDYRQTNQLEPYTRCKPSGGFRQVATAYGTQFVNFPDLQQFIIFQTGGPHSFRTIYMDGRSHPKDLAPSYYGHSIGHFEGDTLVVDTVGYNERMWVSNLEGMPHTDRLHTIETLYAHGLQHHTVRNDDR